MGKDKTPPVVEYPLAMALIEYLGNNNWREVLRRSFEGAIALLQTDRFRLTSSAIDDVRSWLTSGGVSRVQLQLDRQIKAGRLVSPSQREIHDFLGQLVKENQRPLIQLMADGIIPYNQADFLVTMGISESEFDAIWQEISALLNHGMNLHARKVAKAQRERVLKYPIFSFHTSIQQRRDFNRR
ncbi:MAG: hypothetical protein DSM106950_36095 [Stigonema ocellatum SAG 48.90 = DSM 106950]|nr:hypothetical protein [Stigonema ocellatum SAG 48.90 = DSM 106950]